MMGIFSRSRSSSDSSVVSQAYIEEFGVKKFEDLRKRHGRKYALEEVAKFYAERTAEEDVFDLIEETDVWPGIDSVECVLGAI